MAEAESLQKDVRVINEYILAKKFSNNDELNVESDSTSTFVPIVYQDSTGDIAKNCKDKIVNHYVSEITLLIHKDEFIDGEVSASEVFMRENFKGFDQDFIKDALMKLYIDDYHNSHILIGVLTMAACVTYEQIEPQGQLMALGSLQHKDISVRDKAIQLFERWNSKKGIPILESLHCDQKWLQRYVDKVVMYLKRDGRD